MKFKFLLSVLAVWHCSQIIFAQTNGVSIGTSGTPPHPSAILDVNDTTKGILISRMSEATRNSLANPANSLFIFNTTSQCFEAYNVGTGTWQSMFCLCNTPGTPTIAAPTNIGFNGFQANWQSVPGATSYFLDLAKDPNFNNIVPGYYNLFVGSGTSAYLSNLSCDSTYYYRVKAGISCGSGSFSAAQQVNMGTCVYCIRMGDNATDVPYGDVHMLNDGSYIITGGTTSTPGGDWNFFATRISPLKTIMWKKSIGGSSTEIGFGSAILSDGNLVIGGYTSSSGITTGSDDIYLVKLDLSGNVIWTKSFGFSSNVENINDLEKTPDGGFVVSGHANYGSGQYDMFAAKFDVNGNFQWARNIGGSNFDFNTGVAVAPDGSIVLAGYTQSFGQNVNNNYDFYIAKLSSSGSLLWTKVVGGNGGDYAQNATIDASGNIYVYGYTNVFGAGGNDGYLVKLDPSGNVLYTKTYGGGSGDILNNLFIDAAGNTFLLGYTQSFGNGSNDMMLLQINPNDGALIKSKAMGSTGGEEAFSMTQDPNNSGYLLVGQTDFQTFGANDFYITKIDNNLDGCCTVDIFPQTGSGGLVTSGGNINSYSYNSGSGGTTTTPGNISIICD